VLLRKGKLGGEEEKVSTKVGKKGESDDLHRRKKRRRRGKEGREKVRLSRET